MSKIVRILISLGLIGYVLYMSGLFSREGWLQLTETFADANLPLLAFTILFTYFIDYVSSVKWYFLARAREMKVSLMRLYGIYLIGRFFNLVLPTSIGGDVVRIAQLSKITGRKADSAAVVFVERFTGFLVLVVLTLVAVMLVFDKQTSIPWLFPSALLVFFAMIACIFLLMNRRVVLFIQNRSVFLGKFGRKFFAILEKFQTAIVAFKHAPRSLFWALVNSLLFYLVAVINVWISVQVFVDGDVSFVAMISAVPLIMFIMNLPLSVGGIGLMEFAYTVILGLYGFEPAVAISTAVLMRAKTLIMGGSGGLVFLMQKEVVSLTPEQIKSMSTSRDKPEES